MVLWRFCRCVWFDAGAAATRIARALGAGATTNSESLVGADTVTGAFSTTVACDALDNQRNVATGHAAITTSTASREVAYARRSSSQYHERRRQKRRHDRALPEEVQERTAEPRPPVATSTPGRPAKSFRSSLTSLFKFVQKPPNLSQLVGAGSSSGQGLHHQLLRRSAKRPVH